MAVWGLGTGQGVRSASITGNLRRSPAPGAHACRLCGSFGGLRNAVPLSLIDRRRLVMKFIFGLRPVLAVALAAIAFEIWAFPSVAQPASGADEIPILILVRHADKAAQPADDPPLTAAGAKRAQDLAEALRPAGVTAIITTQLRRTRDTAQPLATALGIVPEVVNVGERALVSNPAADAQFPPEVLKERSEYIKALEP